MFEKVRTLTLIKLLHTAVWAVMAASTIFLVYCGVVDHIWWLTWAAMVLMLGESTVIMLNSWVCPLTPIAARHTDRRGPNFDIYLPRWLAKYNKHIFGPLLAIGVGLVVWRVVSK